MSIPNYIGEQSMLFTAEWQASLFSQINLVKEKHSTIRLNYIDTRMEQLPAEFKGVDTFHMVKNDTLIIHDHNDTVIGFVCLSFDELISGISNVVSIYLSVNDVFVLPEYRDKKLETISCLLACALGRQIKKHLINEPEDYTKATVHFTYETQGSQYLSDCGSLFCRIFRGQCKPDPVKDTRAITIEHRFLVDGVLNR